MPPRSSTAVEPSKLEQLVPEDILRVLGEPPILPFESEEDFNALFVAMILYFNPKGLLEFMLVWEITVHQWIISSLASMHKSAMMVALPAAAMQLMKPQLADGFDIHPIIEGDVAPTLRMAAAGSAEHQEFFDRLMKKAGVSRQMLQVAAYSKSLDTISAIDDAIAKRERRRDQAIRILDERRKTLSAMARNGGPEHNSVVDVEASDAAGKKAIAREK